jgi:hypothetical protein
MKDLGSHAWIAETYGGTLPDEPWLAPRRGPARPAIARNTGT